ncbi:MAG: NAD-dependent epimerase/dehydratase family protein, partial [Ignavibacteria bacterium]|nr:NAD-dependent epimerase/dehydratase family protein [Ignavibacteria bacterium]
MKVAITGATGLIGKKLTKKLIERGDEVFVLSRSVDSAKQILPNASGFIEWGNNSNAWQSKLSDV